MANDGLPYGGGGAGSPGGVALVVGAGERRRAAAAAVAALGLTPAEFDDPYAAMADLCRRPAGQVAAVVLGLQALHREELQIVPAVRRARAGVGVWVTDLDARPAALAEAMRLGVDGLLGPDGLHRLDGPRRADGDPPRPPAADKPPVVPPLAGPPAVAAPGGEPRRAAAEVRRVGRAADGVASGRPTGGGRVPAAVDASARAATVPAKPSAGGGRRGGGGTAGLGAGDDPFPVEPLLSAAELRALLGDPDPSPDP